MGGWRIVFLMKGLHFRYIFHAGVALLVPKWFGGVAPRHRGNQSEGTKARNQKKTREKLELRWPGIPFPQLPPKKAIGNKDINEII